MADNGIYQEVFDKLRELVLEKYPDPLQLLTRKQAAELTQLPVGTLDYLSSTDQIPYIRTGKRNKRFSPLMLLAWYAERHGVEYRKPQQRPKKKRGTVKAT